MSKELDSQIIVNSSGCPLELTHLGAADAPMRSGYSLYNDAFLSCAPGTLFTHGERPSTPRLRVRLPLSSAYRFCVSFALKTGGQAATQAGTHRHAPTKAGRHEGLISVLVTYVISSQGGRNLYGSRISDLGWGDYLLRCDDVMSHEIHRIHHHINTSTLMLRWFQREASELITNEYAYMHTYMHTCIRVSLHYSAVWCNRRLVYPPDDLSDG
jgi:hypothetical protein